MTQGQIDYAVRKAQDNFDKWNDSVGLFTPSDGPYSEMMGVIEDAVHIGAQIAIFGNIETVGGEISKNRKIES